MIESLLIPLLSLSLIDFEKPEVPQVETPKEFQITYVAKGRRSPFVSPQEFRKIHAGMDTAERYRALFEGLTREEILVRLKQDLSSINGLVDKGSLKEAFESTDAVYQNLRNSKLRGLEAITHEYKKVYDNLITKINYIRAQESFEKLQIVISGIIHAREGSQAILDGSHLVEEGDSYKGVTILRIHKNTIEFNLNGVTLVREFKKL